MRKILFFPIFILFFFVFSQSPSFAQNIATQSSEPTPQKINYTLPYPGMLPDNPLYFLKTLRDKIVTFLISDPLKEAEFALLTSDKRIAASEMLFNKNKKDLAITTLSKSNNYFFNALSSVKDIKKENTDLNRLLETLSLSAKKHLEIVQRMQKNIEKEFEDRLSQEVKRLEEFSKNVEELRPSQ